MELSQKQKQDIQNLKEELETQLWEDTYYGETPNKKVVELFREGVELNYEVTITPYEGVEHK